MIIKVYDTSKDVPVLKEVEVDASIPVGYFHQHIPINMVEAVYREQHKVTKFDDDDDTFCIWPLLDSITYRVLYDMFNGNDLFARYETISEDTKLHVVFKDLEHIASCVKICQDAIKTYKPESQEQDC